MLDSITVQALLSAATRRVCGMTGTAVAVAEQLREFYELEVLVIPPNKECVRDDEPAGSTRRWSRRKRRSSRRSRRSTRPGRPILIGTLDVAESERLAAKLRRGRPASAWCSTPRTTPRRPRSSPTPARTSAVTVSTQMAGPRYRHPAGRPRRRRPRPDRRAGRPVRRSAPAVTPAAGWTTSCAAAPDVRATPAARCSSLSLQDELITQYAPDADEPSEVDDDGRVGRRGHPAHRRARPARRRGRATSRSTATPGGTTSSSSTSATLILEHRDKVLRTGRGLREARRATGPRAACPTRRCWTRRPG